MCDKYKKIAYFLISNNLAWLSGTRIYLERYYYLFILYLLNSIFK